MEFLTELGLFALKTAIIVGGILTVAAFLFQLTSRGRSHLPHLDVEKLNSRFRAYRRNLALHVLDKKDYKRLLKEEKKNRKEEKTAQSEKPRVFILDFDGDIRASQVHGLREEITALLSIAKPETDEVVIRLESGGGLVTSYGLAASQLTRIRDKKIKLTVCIDKIAASGGYMMACVADRVLAAPFSVVGSIGVIAQVPNLNRVLKKHDVDYREITAGEFKRTVTIFGEITEPGLTKFREQIEATHQLFKKFVQSHRPRLDLAKVATGEHWYALEALELGLVDTLQTSDEYLLNRSVDAELFHIRYRDHKKLIDRITEATAKGGHQLASRLLDDAQRARFGLS